MPNKLYRALETAIVFKSAAGDALFTPTSLANGAGRVSARYDRGALSQADRFIFRARVKCATAPVVGAILTIYLALSDGTDADGELATTDAALPAADRRRNLRPIGCIQADEASAIRFFTKSDVIEVPDRYIQVVFYNELGVALSATATDHFFSLTPVPPELQ